MDKEYHFDTRQQYIKTENELANSKPMIQNEIANTKSGMISFAGGNMDAVYNIDETVNKDRNENVDIINPRDAVNRDLQAQKLNNIRRPNMQNNLPQFGRKF